MDEGTPRNKNAENKSNKATEQQSLAKINPARTFHYESFKIASPVPGRCCQQKALLQVKSDLRPRNVHMRPLSNWRFQPCRKNPRLVALSVKNHPRIGPPFFLRRSASLVIRFRRHTRSGLYPRPQCRKHGESRRLQKRLRGHGVTGARRVGESQRGPRVPPRSCDRHWPR